MSYIIDADWIIEMSRNNQRTLLIVERLRSTRIHVSWVTLGEVYEPAYNSPNPTAYLHVLRQYSESFETIGVDSDIIERYAEIRAFLRRRGQMFSESDMLVAATALSRDLTVLTYNRRHFERIPDLRVYRADG